ncbi:MAG TPA: hypothetical protein VKI44_05845 [Acetobacteraceae bacterium]|nr:hypothetical protein [Acetobacteraceae bacterium]
MTNAAFFDLLIDMLAKTIPTDADHGEAAREAGLSVARTLLQAWQPADEMEAAQAARAIAALLAAMDSFARAARPGVSDEKAVRLRSNAIAAGRQFDNLLRICRRQRQPAQAEAQPRFPRPAARVAAPAERVRDRADLPLPIPGLSDAVMRATRRVVLSGDTALAPVQPTVPVPG